MFARLRRYLLHRKYFVGAKESQFLACDIRRDIEVVDASELDDGFITARLRTWNVMYVAHGVAAEPAFEPARRIALAELWSWTGEPWGGPIPDDDLSRRS